MLIHLVRPTLLAVSFVTMIAAPPDASAALPGGTGSGGVEPGAAGPPRPFDAVVGIETIAGAHVIKVEPGSVAAQAGLAVGDLLESCNGKTLKELGTLEEFARTLRESAMLSSARVTVWKYDPVIGSYAPTEVDLRMPASEDARLGIAFTQRLMVRDAARARPSTAAAAGSAVPAEPIEVAAWDFIEQVDGETVADMRSLAEIDLLAGAAARRHEPVQLTLGRWKPITDSPDFTILFEPKGNVSVATD